MSRADISARVSAILNERRNGAFIAANENYARASKDEKFRRADLKARDLTIKVSLLSSKGEDAAEEKKQLRAAEKARDKRLSELGLSVFPVFTCPDCEDTGMTREGKLCKCAQKLYREIAREKAALTALPSFRFENDTLSRRAGGNLSAAYEAMKRYASNFPNVGKKAIVFTGGVGTGKTCLVCATAGAIADRGFDVAYCTAFSFNDLLVKYHTAPIENKPEIIAPLLESDLLVIDDLGTEPVFRNVTVEYLYDVISSRIAAGRAIFITTNLTASELCDRYGERIFSRLSDKRCAAWKALDGGDLRHFPSD